MVYKYQYGTPIETEAVIKNIKKEEGNIPFFEVILNTEGLEFLYSLAPEDIIYGLGEQVRGINKRGWIYENYCTDDPEHTEGKHSLYSAHNFFIIKGKETFGAFFDYPGRIIFDFDYTKQNQAQVKMEANNLYVYIIIGGTLEDIVHEFRTIIGTSYIPPKWAFGYQQSRWGYETEADILKVVSEHRNRKIPLDAIYLDIDYMESFKDFTIDKKKYPNFEKFVQKLKEQHVKVVPIIDAGVKIEENYSVYEEGKKYGYFCKKEDGNDFIGGAWPGKVHFPDFLNPEVRVWFGNKYQDMIESGVEGFWNDMNEPAVFYSEEGLNQIYQKARNMNTQETDLNDFLELQPMINNIANNSKDYKNFYHTYQNNKIQHDKVHNLYGYYMTRAAAEAMEQIDPQKRKLLFSRSSYIGMHRYGGIWTGDNKSWWSHLLLNIKMMPSLNMCGFLYSGADVGGFGDDTTQDLLLRWMQFAIFTPLFRNHSALGTRRQEIYEFENAKSMRQMLGLRYGLLPYIYSEFIKAALNGTMYFRPLGFDYDNDEAAVKVEDQLLVGESIMIAPVYEQNAEGRCVYLPEEMILIKFKSLKERIYERLDKGYHYITVKEDEVAVFLRKNHLLPLSFGGQHVEDLNEERLELLGFVTESAEYEWYNDDGYTKDYENQDSVKIVVKKKDSKFYVRCGVPVELTKLFE